MEKLAVAPCLKQKEKEMHQFYFYSSCLVPAAQRGLEERGREVGCCYSAAYLLICGGLAPVGAGLPMAANHNGFHQLVPSSMSYFI